MKNLFTKLSNQPTSLDGYDKSIINYTALSEKKATRLSKISEELSPEPFVLEVKEKRGNKLYYKAYTFISLEEALNFQNQLSA